MLNPMRIIKDLNFERLSGTAGEEKGVTIICDYIRDLGWEPVVEEFEINAFEPGEVVLEIAGKKFMGTPYGMNANADFESEFVWLENINMVKYNRGKYKNKIVAAYNASRGMMPMLKEQGIKCIIGVGRPFHEATSLSHRQSTVDTGYVHALTVDHETGIKLKRLDGGTMSVKLQQKTFRGKAHNIIVDIPGKGYDETLTIAGGHLDTVAHSPGASDNGGGVVALLKLLEHFKKHQPARDLRIVFFGAEELGLLGSQDYVNSHLDELKKRLGLMVNIDVSGDAMGMDMLAVIGGNKLLGYTDGLVKEAGYCFTSKLDIYSSDSMPFAIHEFPSVNIARFGGKASNMIHTSGDNYKNVSSDGYKSTIKVSIHMLEKILNAGVYPVEPEIDSSLREKIEKYIWKLNYEEPKLEWEKKYKK